MTIRVRRALLLVSMLLLSAAFLLAGTMKLPDVEGFAQVIASYDIIPACLAGPMALYLPWAEIVFAVALWLPKWRLAAATLAALFLLAFTVSLLTAWSAGATGDCGCMGGVPLSIPQALLRNAVLLAAAGVSIAFARRPGAVSSS